MVFPFKHYLQRKTLMTPCHHQPDPDPIQEMQKSAAEARNKNRSALCFGRLEAVGHPWYMGVSIVMVDPQ